MINLIIFGKT